MDIYSSHIKNNTEVANMASLNFLMWIMFCISLVLHYKQSLSVNHACLAVSAGMVSLMLLIFPSSPILCQLFAWVVLSSLLMLLWCKKSEVILGFYAKYKPCALEKISTIRSFCCNLKPIVDLEEKTVTGEEMIGRECEITAIYRDGYITLVATDKSLGSADWKGRDLMVMNKDLPSLAVGDRLVVTSFIDGHLTVRG